MFKDKVVVITGAAGGIGRVLAAQLARGGARLVLADIRRDKLEEVRRRVISEAGDALAVEHDVTNAASWQMLMNRVLDRFGRLDVLINNAGVIQPGPAEQISPAKIEEQVSVNLLGTIFGCQAALRVMKRQDSGRIINIASLGGVVPMPGEAVYSATKFAIRGYSLSLAAELQGTGIRVTAVCPDSVDTPQLAYELLHDEAVMSFIGNPLTPEKAAKGILKAAGGKKPEVLVPGGMGVFCRIAMAFPRFYFVLLPVLKRIGSRGIARRRRAELGRETVLAAGAKSGR
jgi:3-oxoacyl-[acyl-carrier protein] reductase